MIGGQRSPSVRLEVWRAGVLCVVAVVGRAWADDAPSTAGAESPIAVEGPLAGRAQFHAPDTLSEASDVRPGSGAPGEPAIMWDRLRGIYEEYLSSVTDDAVGLRTAEFLRRSTVALEAADLQSRLGEDVFAAYDAASRRVLLDRRGLKEVSLSLQSAELQPERAQPFIERTAGALVHEIRHAIDHEAMGEAPLFLESELAAYADQALFLRRRIERDPGYRGLGALDDAVAERLGKRREAAGGRWWTLPLRGQDMLRLKDAVAVARRRLGERWTSQEANDWFLVRAWAGGLRAFEDALVRAGYLPPISLLEPPAGVAERSRGELEHLWRQLAVLRSSKLPPQERERRARRIEADLDSAERIAAFWGDPQRRERAREYVARVLDERRKDGGDWNGNDRSH